MESEFATKGWSASLVQGNFGTLPPLGPISLPKMVPSYLPYAVVSVNFIPPVDHLGLSRHHMTTPVTP